METKEIILTKLSDNAFGIKIDYYQLLGDLEEYYHIYRAESERVISECLKEGLITIDRNRLDIRQKGLDWLKNKNGNEKEFFELMTEGRSTSSKIKSWFNPKTITGAINLIAAIMTIIGGVVTIYLSITQK